MCAFKHSFKENGNQLRFEGELEFRRCFYGYITVVLSLQICNGEDESTDNTGL